MHEGRQILLYNDEGKCLAEWQPGLGSLYKAGTYYSIQWKQAKDAIIKNNVMEKIIAQIIPDAVMNWLLKNSFLYKIWKEVMIENNTANILFQLLQQANFSKSIPNLTDSNISLLIEADVTELNLNNTKLINQLLNFLNEINHDSKSIHWLRVNEGLFIPLKTLNDFILKHNNVNEIQQLIDSIQSCLVELTGKYHLRYRPKAFADRRILEGIVLKEDILSDKWKQQIVNTEFNLSPI